MPAQVLLLDFDGTIVTKDMLSEVIDLVGKKHQSEVIDKEFQAGKLPGLSALISRINLLKGVSVEQIQAKVKQDLALIPGTRELLAFCKQQKIVTILASGSIVSILEVYQQELGIDYLVGSQPEISQGKIIGISQDDYPPQGHFKVVGITSILENLELSQAQIVAIGDGRGDIPMFELATTKLAINPKGGIEEFAEYVITDLNQALSIIRGL